MTNKEQFLLENVGFHYKDLSVKRKLELNSITKRLKVNDEWVLAALSFHTLEEWERFGFGLMKSEDFQEEVKGYLEGLNKITEEEFEKEIKKSRILVNEEDFRARWSEVKKQGRVYTPEEAKEKGLRRFITYRENFENGELIDQWVEQYDELPMELWTTFYLSTMVVMVVSGGVW